MPPASAVSLLLFGLWDVMRHLQLPVPVTGELWLWGDVRGPSLHGGHAGELSGDKTKVPDPFPPDAQNFLPHPLLVCH